MNESLDQYADFLRALRLSGLINCHLLSKEIEGCEANFTPLQTPKVKARELAKVLVDKSILSEWQSEKLILGKYKGFFIGGYELREHLGRHHERNNVQVFLARDPQDRTLELVLEFEDFWEQLRTGKEPAFSISYYRHR
jgi:hypothetical protein